MLLCYQVATPDVAIADSVTAYQGSLDKSLGDLAAMGYDGVEFMTLNPQKLDWPMVLKTAQDLGLKIPLVCSGEVYGQLKISFTDPDAGVRREAIDRVKELADFAGFLGGNINIGRVRGQYALGVAREQSWEWAVEAFQEISDHGAKKDVKVALETINILQSNFINTLDEALKITQDVNRPNFSLMMDVFHMNMEEPDLIEAIRKYCPYNIHVHLSDSNRRYPGSCGMDMDKVIQAFRESGYDGAFCTEIFQLPDMETCARRSIENLAPIFEKHYGRVK